MARRKTKTKAKAKARKKAPAKTVARAKPKPKSAAKPVVRASAAGRRTTGSPGSDVERRWKEYWASRNKLEAAVEKVKTARDALSVAQDSERGCRSEFETIKSSLTELLDVEPAGGPQRSPSVVAQRQPAGGPTRSPTPQGLPAPQAIEPTKPAS